MTLRVHWLGLSFFLLGACDSEDKFTVTGACGTTDFGYGSPSKAARDGLDRSNCYRSLMGLELGTLDRRLDDAAQSHADYMADHDMITHQESSSKTGFTGEWVWDRMETVGYPVEAGFAWSEVVSYGFDAEAAVDGWMGTVYHRIPFSQPVWTDVGFGLTGDYAAMAFVTPYPDGVHEAVLFPVDGQADVPTSFDSDTETPDPAPAHGVVGYPITVTVGGENPTGPFEDPFNLRLLDASLWESDGGEVDVITMDPTTDDSLYVMAAMIPVEPLSANTEYEAEMTVEWDGGSETIVAEFRTLLE